MTNNYPEGRIPTILDEHAKALLDDDYNQEAFMQRHNISANSWLADLINTAELVHDSMPLVEPSSEFVNQLYRELIGQENRNWLDRLSNINMENLPNVDIAKFRELPRPMQLVAGLGGLTLIYLARRAVREEPGGESEDGGGLTELSPSERSA